MVNDSSANITYENVRNGASKIQNCAKIMDGIFQDFNSSMNRVGAPDVYLGDANETLSARYNSLKTSFDEYKQLVEQFSQMILGAASSTEATENRLASAAEELKTYKNN